MFKHAALAFAFVLCLPRASSAATGDSLLSFPSSFPSPDGLMWDGTSLWATDCSVSRIDKVDLLTGQVIGSIDIPEIMGSDEMAWDGKNMWISDHSATEMPGMGAPPPRIYYADPVTQKVIKYFEAPGVSKYPMGLAWDGKTIWNVDTWDKKIYQLDAATGDIIRSIPSPAPGACGMTWDGACIWLSDAQADGLVYHIDPNDGQVIRTFPGPGGEGHMSTGVAWDGKNLWIHDEAKGKAAIHKIEVEDITENGRCLGAYVAEPEGAAGAAGQPPAAAASSGDSGGCNMVFAPSFEHAGSVLVALLGLVLSVAWREVKRGGER